MSRPRSSMPAYQFHVSGQAVVRLGSPPKDFYLGKYDSPQSRSRYFALLAEYNDNGKQAPQQPSHQADLPITIRCVAAEFREFTKSKPGGDAKEKRRMLNLCTTLEDEYGDEPAADFGPRKLAALRDLFVAGGNSRKYANRQTHNVIRIFKHAVSRELIDEGVHRRLMTLEPLRRGQTKSPETSPVVPVDIAIVRKTAEHLSPTLRAMVRIQAATGMRRRSCARSDRPTSTAAASTGSTDWRITRRRGEAKSNRFPSCTMPARP